jgi:V8-like Glu-specific endopeptidase
MSKALVWVTGSLLLVGCEGALETPSDDTALRQGAIINGQDDRVNISQAPAAAKELAKGTLAFIPSVNLTANADGSYRLAPGPATGLCPDERFASEIAPAECSAFLVAPDLAATAGHCIDARPIGVHRLVLGFYDSSPWGPAYQNVPAENVFTIASTVYRYRDTAIVRLDHAAPPFAKPYRMSATDIISLNVAANPVPVALMGFPFGLPMKFAPNGAVRAVYNTGLAAGNFETNLDAQGGNSGGPVFDASTFQVYGTYNNGGADSTTDSAGRCLRWARCDPQYTYCRELGQSAVGMGPLLAPAGTPVDPTYDLFGRFSGGTPGIVVLGSREYVIFTGDDQRIYWRRRDTSSTITAPAEVPGGMLSKYGPAAVSYRGDIYLVARGLDDRLYYTSRSSIMGTWSSSWVAIAAPAAGQFSPPLQMDGGPTAFFQQLSSGNIASDDLVVSVRDTSSRIFQNVYRFSTNMTTYTPTYVGWSGWSISDTSAVAAPVGFRRTSVAYAFTPKSDGTIRKRAYSSCASTVAGCWGTESTVPNAVATKYTPGIVSPYTGTWWLLMRDANDQIYELDFDDNANFPGYSPTLVHTGRAFSAPVGSNSFGTWWLYTTGADREIVRY